MVVVVWVLTVVGWCEIPRVEWVCYGMITPYGEAV